SWFARARQPRFCSAVSCGEGAYVDFPETRYAKTADGVSVAYQLVGEGRPDIVHQAPAQAPTNIRRTTPRQHAGGEERQRSGPECADADELLRYERHRRERSDV